MRKMAVIRKSFFNCLWILSVWYFVIMAINFISQYSWKLFTYDLRSGFRDNRFYFEKFFLPVTVCTVMISIIFILFLDSNLIMYWKVRIGRLYFRIGDITCIRKHKTSLMMVTIFGAVSLLFVVSYRQMNFESQITGGGVSRTIAHAGGIIDGYDYTNCLEAILTNYDKGQRVFEIDFAVTSDNKLVCKHNWKEVLQEGGVSGEPMDAKKFMSTPILGQYTPLSWETLCQLMNDYPDIRVVTDTKHTNQEAVQQDFQIMVDTAKELGMESVLDRIIVQIYNEEMYDTVCNIYPFKSFIYTLYKFWKGDAETFLDCVRFCYEHDFQGITTWNHYVSADLMQITNAYDLPWYAHTENDVENAKDMFKLGLSGIYTDSIVPNMLASDETE